MSRRAVGRSAALALMITLLMTLLGGGVAQALPGIPDCKAPPAPIAAGSGISGMVDPGPVPAPAFTDPFAAKATTTVYEQYGYAGLRWSTYDLGCLGGVNDPGAQLDTVAGNWALGLSVFLVSLANGLHSAVVNPSWLTPLDSVTAEVTRTVHDALWQPWGAVSMLVVVGLMLLSTARGNLPETVAAGAWALLVLTIMAGVVAYPQRAGQLYDQAVIGTLSSLEQTTSAQLSPSVDATGGSGRPGSAALVDQLLYQAWLRGEVGATGGQPATWGAALFQAQALSYSDVVTTTADPARRTAVVAAKNSAWTATTSEIASADPGTYAAVQGRAGGRLAAGGLALFAAVATSSFRIVADLFLAAGLVMLRVLVMVFPAVAILGVIMTFSPLVRRIGNAAGASIINVVAFGAASLVHSAIVTAALSRTSGDLSWMALVLCLLVTIILFVLCLPLLSLTAIAGGTPRNAWNGGAVRTAVRRAGHRFGVRRGGDDEPDDAAADPSRSHLSDSQPPDSQPPDSQSSDSQPSRSRPSGSRSSSRPGSRPARGVPTGLRSAGTPSGGTSSAGAGAARGQPAPGGAGEAWQEWDPQTDEVTWMVAAIPVPARSAERRELPPGGAGTGRQPWLAVPAAVVAVNGSTSGQVLEGTVVRHGGRAWNESESRGWHGANLDSVGAGPGPVVWDPDRHAAVAWPGDRR